MNTTAPITVHGIANCDTIRRARKWLEENGVAHRFHDYRKDGVEVEMLRPWVNALGVDALLNRRGTTWRSLGDDDRARVEGGNAEAALSLMATHPALIKRPLFDFGGDYMVGFGKREQDILARRFGIA
ncbi:MAG: ArsC family reductase [Sphingomonadales bacterium]